MKIIQSLIYFFAGKTVSKSILLIVLAEDTGEILSALRLSRCGPHRGPFPLCILSQVAYPPSDTQLLVNFLCLCPQPMYVRLKFQILRLYRGRFILVVIQQTQPIIPFKGSCDYDVDGLQNYGEVGYRSDLLPNNFV